MKNNVSIPNAKDAIDRDLAFAIQADARNAKRDEIMQPAEPLHISRFGAFIVGLLSGVIITVSIALFIATARTIVIL